MQTDGKVCIDTADGVMEIPADVLAKACGHIRTSPHVHRDRVIIVHDPPSMVLHPDTYAAYQLAASYGV